MRALSKEETDTAQIMLGDLEREWLSVSLVPCERGTRRKLRKADGVNPLWYQSLCADFMTVYKVKAKTIIKRQDTIRGLNEIVSGRCESLYTQRLIGVVRAEIERYKEIYY